MWFFLGIFLIGIIVLVLLLVTMPRTTTALPPQQKSILPKLDSPWRVLFCANWLSYPMPQDHRYVQHYRDQPEEDISVVVCNNDDEMHAMFTPNTIVVLVNTMRDVSRIPPQHVLGLSHEPLAFSDMNFGKIENIQKACGRYYMGDSGGLASPFQSHYAYLYSEEPQPMPIKTKVMSLMVSDKKMTAGQQYRHRLARAILQSDLPVDIWGRGADAYLAEFGGDKRIRGNFQSHELYHDYSFSIAIENVAEPNYISEKFINCICYHTTCVYLGGPNVDDVFGKDVTIRLTGHIDSDLKIIQKICLDPNKYTKDMTYARQQLTRGGKANLLTHIRQVIIPEIINSRNLDQ